MYTEVWEHLKEMLEIGQSDHHIAHGPAQWYWFGKMMARWICIDLLKYNTRTIKDSIAFPALNGAAWLWALDLKSGYWKVELDESSQPLMAFTIGPLGFYKCEKNALWTCKCSCNTPTIDGDMPGNLLFN